MEFGPFRGFAESLDILGNTKEIERKYRLSTGSSEPRDVTKTSKLTKFRRYIDLGELPTLAYIYIIVPMMIPGSYMVQN